MHWTAVSTDEMTMITNPPVVRRERFFTNMASRRVTIRLPLFFRQRFHISEYDIFHSMRQIVKLSREPRYTVFIAMEVITRRTCIARSILY